LDAPRRELLPGTLDLLILHTLQSGPMHGYGIAQHIGRLSDAVLRVEEGSLYPALQRLQKQGWVRSKWGVTSTSRRARFYTITAAGRTRLGVERSDFDVMLGAIRRVLRPV
jgi:PadR family transcriptional regulator, regulatory protein PadR